MGQSRKTLVLKITGQARVVFETLKVLVKTWGNKTIEDLTKE